MAILKNEEFKKELESLNETEKRYKEFELYIEAQKSISAAPIQICFQCSYIKATKIIEDLIKCGAIFDRDLKERKYFINSKDKLLEYIRNFLGIN